MIDKGGLTDFIEGGAPLSLEESRAQLDALDAEIISLAAKRRRLIAPIAAAKRRSGLPLRDYRREREVILRARGIAASLGLSPKLADAIMEPLISDSLTMQELAQVAIAAKGHGKAALVIGGKGKMGSWFAEFLLSQGYRVICADPAISAPSEGRVRDWRECRLAMDVIVVATPMGVTNQVLLELAARRPGGLIFDISSLKTPLRSGFQALIDAGCTAMSMHPMFGPDIAMLSGKHVVLIDIGAKDAMRAAEGLFAATMAHLSVMSLDEHDRLIGYVLGLSHAVNVAFAAVLADSGPLRDRLLLLSSTTFDAQATVAMGVTEEDVNFYYQIQRLNEFGLEPLRKLRETVSKIYGSVQEADSAVFEALMVQGREYLQQHANALWRDNRRENTRQAK